MIINVKARFWPFLILLSFFASFASAYAQSDAPTRDSDPVLVFNRVCYAQVPVLKNIRDMATRLAWERIGGDDLKQFSTVQNPSVLEGWDVRIAKRLYRLGIVQTPAGERFEQNFPEFTGGTATSCFLVLDGRDDAGVILERMNALARKAPTSENLSDGELFTTTWAGGNEDFKVFLIYKSSAENKASLLNVTILSKEK